MLIERDFELGRIGAAVARAREGDQVAVVITAAAGLGKTALVDAGAAMWESAGFEVLHARASPLESGFAFGVVRQLFERRVGGTGSLEVRLGRPGVPTGTVLDEVAATDGRPADVTAVLHSLVWMLGDMAEARPVVLVVDDAHWGDEPSLRFLEFTQRRLNQLQVSLLLATRPLPEMEVDSQALCSLAAAPGVEHLEPAPLTRSGCDALLAQKVPPPADDTGRRAWETVAAECYKLTEGNPLFVQTIAQQLSVDLIRAGHTGTVIDAARSRSVRRAVLAGLGRLEPPCHELARALAITGDNPRLDVVAELSGLAGSEVIGAADKLAAAGILRRDSWLSFSHPVVREAVQAEMSATAVAQRHLQAAMASRRAGADDEVLAVHLLNAPAGAGDWVAELLARTARRAMREGAPETAAQHLARAVGDCPPAARPEMLLELGVAEFTAGWAGCLPHLSEALRSASSPGTAAQAALVGSREACLRGDVEVAQRLCQDAQSKLSEHPDLSDRIEIQFLSICSVMIGLTAFDQQVAQLAGRLERMDMPSRGLAAGVLAVHAAQTGASRHQIKRLADQAWGDGQLLTEYTSLDPIVYTAVVGALAAEEAAEAERRASAIIADARARKAVAAYAPALCFRGWTRLRTGALSGAEGDLSDALRTGTDARHHLITRFATAMLGEVLFERGETERAQQVFLNEMAAAPQESARTAIDFLELRAGKAAFATGDHARALELLTVARQHAPAGQPSTAFEPALPWLALAQHATGRGHQAANTAQQAIREGQASDSRRALGQAMLAQAHITDAGPETFANAAQLLEVAQAPLDHTRALVRYGAALRRQGQRARAREHLQRSRHLAISAGFTTVANEAARELNVLGVRVPTTEKNDPYGLTPAERRVARLAAEGMTNRTIAQSLFVTTKTVETQLSSAYRKLAVSGRAGLQQQRGQLHLDERV